MTNIRYVMKNGWLYEADDLVHCASQSVVGVHIHPASNSECVVGCSAGLQTLGSAPDKREVWTSRRPVPWTRNLVAEGQFGVSFSRQIPASLLRERGTDARFSLESRHVDGLGLRSYPMPGPSDLEIRPFWEPEDFDPEIVAQVNAHREKIATEGK